MASESENGGLENFEVFWTANTLSARPVQAAFASAGTFAIGAAMPLLTAVVTPKPVLIPLVVSTSILFLALLGGFGAYAGSAP